MEKRTTTVRMPEELAERAEVIARGTISGASHLENGARLTTLRVEKSLKGPIEAEGTELPPEMCLGVIAGVVRSLGHAHPASVPKVVLSALPLIATLNCPGATQSPGHQSLVRTNTYQSPAAGMVTSVTASATGFPIP